MQWLGQLLLQKECLQDANGGMPKPNFSKIQQLHPEENIQVASYAKLWTRILAKLAWQSDTDKSSPSTARKKEAATTPVRTPITQEKKRRMLALIERHYKDEEEAEDVYFDMYED